MSSSSNGTLSPFKGKVEGEVVGSIPTGWSELNCMSIFIC